MADSNNPSIPEVDPLLEQINAFWEDFMDVPYENQWTAVTKMLAEEPELCDGEMVFEIANDLFAQAVGAYEAFTLFELLPAWLRFLTKYALLDEGTRLQIIKEVSYLKGHFIQIATNNVTDPALKRNVVDWPYGSATDLLLFSEA